MRGETAMRSSGSVRPAGSGPGRPSSAASSGAQSAGVRAIGPAWSSVGASGTAPRSDVSPRDGFSVDVPQSADGIRSEPAVSVPVAAGVMPAASAAAEPPLEPPGERSSAHGLPTWSVVPPTANSCVWTCPSSTMPAAASRAQRSLSRAGTSSSSRLDAVSGFPATANRSFRPTGTPQRGGASPPANRASARPAAASASSS